MNSTPVSKRAYCPTCGYPLTVCLCAYVKRIDNHCEVVILQHPSEAKVAKNTARLLDLTLSNCRIIIGESAEDFDTIRRSDLDKTAVLYPGDSSDALLADSTMPERLILLDGTWRKAYRIWQLNPWLHSLTQYHLHQPPNGIYQRKAKGQHQLSTLEACAYALQQIEHTDPGSLLRLLQARQQKGF